MGRWSCRRTTSKRSPSGVDPDRGGGPSCRPRGLRLLEDDRPGAVHEDAVLEVQPNGAGQHAPLDLAPEADEVVHRVAVGYVGDVLVDYWACVELLAHVVGRGAYGLHTPLVGPPVGVGAREGRQERVVAVY